MTLLRAIAICAILAPAVSMADEPAPAAGARDAAAILAGCRNSLPARPVTLKGNIILRNRKGIPSGEYSYVLSMDRTAFPATLSIDVTERGATNVLEHLEITRPGKVPDGYVMKTDVRWLDLSLDFLWWNDPYFEDGREGESVHGQTCDIILVRPPPGIDGIGAVRLWADRKTGCLMQAEELDTGMKPHRRLWGRSIKKFDGRWMANTLEAETLGSGHRTKITVDSVEDGAPEAHGG